MNSLCSSSLALCMSVCTCVCHINVLELLGSKEEFDILGNMLICFLDMTIDSTLKSVR